jgi:hypothetical protein
MNMMAQTFATHGYVVVNDVFTSADAVSFREQILSAAPAEAVHGHVVRWNQPHGVSLTPQLWPLVTYPALLDAVRAVLGTNTIRYAEHSDVKIWRRQPASGWHRDSIAEQFGTGPEWDEEYRAVRVACYFQPAAESFHWGALPGSHCGEQELHRWERALWERVQRTPVIAIDSRMSSLKAYNGRPWIRTQRPAWPWLPPVEPVWIPTEPTSCILFDPRLIHAGGPVVGTKVAAFFAFAVDGAHAARHAAHFGRSSGSYRHASESQFQLELRSHDLHGA